MQRSSGFSIKKILLFLPFLLLVLFAFFCVKKSRLESKRTAISSQVGKPFPLLPLVDATGKATQLDFSKSGETIIDFWYKGCWPCIVEMQQFNALLKDAQTDISIISISIDDSITWHKAINGEFAATQFIQPNPKWKHFLLNYPAGGSNNNQQLASILNVTGFPSFFVLDQQGKILATPPSAVEYVKTSFQKQNAFLVFLTSKTTWTSKQTWIVLLLSLFIYQLLVNISVKKAVDKN